MVKMIGMYLLMGLICNSVWAIGMSIFIGQKTKWDVKLMDDALDIFLQVPIGSKLINKLMKSKDGRKQLAISMIISYMIWPINIATGASRLPETFEFIDERLSRTERGSN